CCPDGGSATDERCRRRGSGSDGMGGMGGQTGAGGGSSSAGGSSSGGSSSGTRCDYTSDCPEGLVCGASGRCQPECKGDRDCDEGLSWSDKQNGIAPGARGGAPRAGRSQPGSGHDCGAWTTRRSSWATP